MFGIFRRKKKDVYKVEYVLSARICDGKAEFDFGDMRTAYVEAEHLMDAQREFASRFPLTPHVYVHRISKMDVKAICA